MSDIKSKLKLGATGAYPEGKLSPADEGALRFAVSKDQRGNVRIDFGKPIAWLAMPPAQAREFAALLLKYAGKDGTQ